MSPSINYLTSDTINRTEWDEWVRSAKNRRIYASSMFLDIFCPRWEALVMGEGEAFMPLTRNRKFGISYLYQPIFVQQLGLFFRDDACMDYFPLFIEKLSASYSFADIAMNEMNSDHCITNQCAKMDNFLLRLDKPYESAAGKYSSNNRRNIIKSERLGTELRPGFRAADVVSLFTGYHGKLYPNIRRKNYEMLGSLLDRGLEEGLIEIKSACTHDGRVIAAVCMLKDYDRYVYYFSANTAEGREHGAMFLLIDSFIRQYSGTGLLLDFNGSMNPNMARFYSGFGAEKTYYPRLRINRLRYPFKLFK